ncbi:MAG: hypothetical protein M1820_004372 [Bogoriella megaspora]|nr:MAG: hypothetical protein M1820_004372 [Bogoriella megaspora]
MGVPFEALIPYGIMVTMFGITGAGLSKLRHLQNGGKHQRYATDQWDRSRLLLTVYSDGSGPSADWIFAGANG